MALAIPDALAELLRQLVATDARARLIASLQCPRSDRWAKQSAPILAKLRALQGTLPVLDSRSLDRRAEFPRFFHGLRRTNFGRVSRSRRGPRSAPRPTGSSWVLIHQA